MTNNDQQRAINPYQPPAMVDAVPGEFAYLDVNLDLDDKHPLPYAGVPTEDDLNQFLENYETLGSLPIFFIVTFMSLLQIWAIVVSGAFALTVAGGNLIFSLVIITSTRWYRALVFRSQHPNWSERVEGELATDGIRINSQHESCYYRWSWFSGVVISDSVVGFVPAQESEMPLLISTSMLPESETFTRLKGFARSAKVICENEVSNASIQWAIQQVMREPKRQRSAVPPAGAIEFRGPVTGEDLKPFFQQLSLTGRPPRTQVIRLLLLFGAGLVALGLVLLIGQALDPAIVLIGLLAPAPLILLVLLRQRRRAKFSSADHLLYYLIAFATNEGITTDFFVSVTTVAWSELAVKAAAADRMLIGRKGSQKVLLARQDMFSSEAQWQEFVDKIPKL